MVVPGRPNHAGDRGIIERSDNGSEINKTVCCADAIVIASNEHSKRQIIIAAASGERRSEGPPSWSKESRGKTKSEGIQLLMLHYLCNSFNLFSTSFLRFVCVGHNQQNNFHTRAISSVTTGKVPSFLYIETHRLTKNGTYNEDCCWVVFLFFLAPFLFLDFFFIARAFVYLYFFLVFCCFFVDF